MKFNDLIDKTKSTYNNSIRRQLALSVSLIVASVIILICILNTCFASLFYKFEKRRDMQEAYASVNSWIANYDYSSDEFLTEFEKICKLNNFDIAIMNTSGSVLVSSSAANDMQNRMFRALLDDSNSYIMKNTDQYTIKQQEDSSFKSDFLILTGVLDNDDIIVIRCAVVGISESVFITNKFLIYIGLVAILLSIIVAEFFSDRIAVPLKELVVLSKRMANLDFKAKYKPREKKNEVDELGEQMNSMSNSLEKAYTELKEANAKLERDIEIRDENEKMRKEFISSVSHELKTPIAIISGYAEGLSEGMCDDKETLDYYCSVIGDEAAKMNSMVLDLIELNKLEYDSEIISMRRFNISELLYGVIESSRILLTDKDIAFRTDIKSDVYITSDENLVERTFSNYLTNAIHFCIDGGYISVSLKETEDMIRVSVFNTGDTIPEDKIDHIWDKFYKADEARSRQYGGTGIGLSIVKASMEILKGRYFVQNKENGVEFWFEIDK